MRQRPVYICLVNLLSLFVAICSIGTLIYFRKSHTNRTKTANDSKRVSTTKYPDLIYLNKNNNDLYQSDIRLTTEQFEILDSSPSTAINWTFDGNGPFLLWQSPIRYEIDATIDLKTADLIRESVDFWQSNTCLNFAEDPIALDRIVFFKGNGCWSQLGNVGRSSSFQSISIGDGCGHFGLISHEIGHALGLFHMHSRSDRDGYIEVNWDNVLIDQRYNFNKEPLASTIRPYDYGSLMHYAENAHAVDQRISVITARDRRYQKTMGTMLGPSFGDLKTVNDLYGCHCHTGSAVLPCRNGGYPHPRHCPGPRSRSPSPQCLCPMGLNGQFCTERPNENDCGLTVEANGQWNTANGSIGDGTTTLRDRMEYCFWHIQSSNNSRIEIEMISIGRICSSACFLGGIELKINSDQRMAGFRFCCPDQTNNSNDHRLLISDTNLVIIMAYNRYYLTQFTIRYRALYFKK